MAISMSKTRNVNNPYEVYVLGDWEWRVLKHYQSPAGESKNPYARVYCAVKSPMTWGGYDLGDTYLRDIKGAATLVYTRAGEDAPIFNADNERVLGTQYNLETW